mmetsp:Transcript_28414/g.64421  ORF Transcript_28414/g.64421 Transcript_28414/m.64421 type:complete len:933 (-) Transcript_28414:35-2833(-)
MYPSGIGSSYYDPRRSTFVKHQTLNFDRGHSALRDYAHSTANVTPFPTDAVGSNLRKGRGLSFAKGIANFDGLVQGQQIGSRPPSAASSRLNQSSARSNRMDEGRVSDREEREASRDVSHFQDQRQALSSRNSAGRFRPHSAPAQRAPVTFDSIPAWAKDELVAPSFAKTVENQKARPVSAKQQQPSVLPLSKIPKWISLDRKVLTFEAFFREAVEDSPLERSRVRRCVMQYYLEDDTFKILEPREENCGLLQGAFLKRHKVPRAGGGVLTWRDIQVPGELSIYQRVFRVTRCDEFTRQFYEELGYSVGQEEVPLDEAKVSRTRPSSAKSVTSVREGREEVYHGRQKNDMTEYIEAKLGKCQDKKQLITQYLRNDRKVLRFYCHWNDRGSDGAMERRPFVLHYFLADDTIEVLEVNTPNSGRDPFPALLKRMKLPKGAGGSVIGGDGRKYVTALDLQVGGVVEVFGRQLVLDACDEATREHYHERYGLDLSRFTRSSPPVPRPRDRPKSASYIPPHNGFGKEEDSRQNCLSLHPKPPKPNVTRLLENKGKMLRFVAKLENAVGFDIERVFTVTYFLDTDELSVFEPPVKNSGRSGGKFMERCRVRKPHSSLYYSEADLFLGARILVYSRAFVLVDADEFSLKYMEDNCDVFPSSDPRRVLAKIASSSSSSSVDSSLRQLDRVGRGRVEEGAFKRLMVGAGLQLNDQELHTLTRRFSAGEQLVDYEAMLRELQEPQAKKLESSRDAGGEDPTTTLQRLLYRRGPSGLRGLERAMSHISRGTGRLDREDVNTVMAYCGIAMGGGELDELFRRHEEDGHVLCEELSRSLRPPLSFRQQDAVVNLFESLEDPTFRTGAIELEELLGRYRAARHPKVASGEISEGEAMRDLEDAMEEVRGAVMLKDLLLYYADVVAGYQLNDEELVELLRATWGFNL